jgi:hypothetical protein
MMQNSFFGLAKRHDPTVAQQPTHYKTLICNTRFADHFPRIATLDSG